MGILRLFRRRAMPAPQPPRHAALAMVLLPSADAFDPTPAITWLHEHSRGLPAIMDFTTDGGVATGQIAGGSVGLAQMPVPIPEGDLEGPTRLAWHWPEAADAVAQHQSHVIVHASSSELDPLTLRLLVTRLAAAVVATGNGLGVYVGDACMVRSAEDFAEQAQAASSEAFPLLLWVSFNLVSDAPGWSAYTMGLTALGHLELEAHHSALTPPQLLGRLADAAYYQLSSGRVLRDGDTFGASASERIRVRHRTSEFLPDVTVAVLDL